MLANKPMASGRLFIHAVNVHQGGGRSLLKVLLQSLSVNIKALVSMDERMSLPERVFPNIQVRWVRASVLQRFLTERWLVRSVDDADTVLCFGNLPPLFRLRARTLVFMQNRYLIENVTLKNLPLKVRLRLAVERLWLSTKLGNVDEFVVQTPTMKRMLEQKIGRTIPIRILPFMATVAGYLRQGAQKDSREPIVYDFVYVASGEAHKNHAKLLDAWCLLAAEGIYPSLCLTLNKSHFSSLCEKINVLSQFYGLKVTNVGESSEQDVLKLYKTSCAGIYPSTFESFGLPLIEATQAGLPVLASELDFVRDVIDPVQTFDPESPISIARAVKRFIGIEEPHLPLLDGYQFVESVMRDADGSQL